MCSEKGLCVCIIFTCDGPPMIEFCIKWESWVNFVCISILCVKNSLIIEYIISRPGRSRGLLYKQLCHSAIMSWFVKISLWRRHALIVKYDAFSDKTDYVTIFQEILNLEEHSNCITGSKVVTILLIRGIKPK